MFNRIPAFATALFMLATAVSAVPAATSSIAPPTLDVGTADYTAVCQTYSTAAVNDVISCFNYLVEIGNNDCIVNGDNVVFCESGTAGIGGSNISEDSSTTSTCYDVALAVQWIFTYCNVDGYVGGSQAANGNGNLIVTVDNVSWFV